MTHEEYLSRIETFTDAPEDALAVLAHAASCAACRREESAAEKALARLEPRKDSLVEEITRWSAAAAILAIVAIGFHREIRVPGGPTRSETGARYVIVGDASGVVAYTPEGMVVGVAPRRPPAEKEVTK